MAEAATSSETAAQAAQAGAACLRINPGNIGNASRVREVIQAAKDHGTPIRIGVNAGSLDRAPISALNTTSPSWNRANARPDVISSATRAR